MSTYTVTEDNSSELVIFWVNEDGSKRWAFHLRGVADQKARAENLKQRAEALLALLVESQSVMGAAMADWCDRRDALIAEINGEREGA